MSFVKGQKAEDLAVKFIKKHSFNIIARNYATSFGEIDIIASKNNIISFIEVKSRQTNYYGFPSEYVSSLKQKKIIKTAKHFIMKNNINGYQQFQFDVIAITGKSEIDYIENAFFEK